jgi:hypothetical protein
MNKSNQSKLIQSNDELIAIIKNLKNDMLELTQSNKQILNYLQESSIREMQIKITLDELYDDSTDHNEYFGELFRFQIIIIIAFIYYYTM